jgi:coenzyme F420-0:L-glutamate ligase
MKIASIKTHKITSEDSDLFKILDQYITELKGDSIVAVTSKIISICEGSILKFSHPGLDPGSSQDSLDSNVRWNDKTKDKLIEEQSQFYLPRESNKYSVSFTITNNILSASAGIDESNGNGFYILWPKNPQESANKIREYLSKKFGIKNVGVVITDSKTTPLRWGVTGIALAHSGFNALNDYIGKPDLFGRPFQYEKLNIADSLASAAVLEMGEGSEQTPLAVITDINNIEFQHRNPTDVELESLKINMEDDLFAPFLSNANWQKGRRK